MDWLELQLPNRFNRLQHFVQELHRQIQSSTPAKLQAHDGHTPLKRPPVLGQFVRSLPGFLPKESMCS